MDTLFNIGSLFLVGILAAGMVLLGLWFVFDRLEDWVFPSVSFSRSLQEGNLAVGIFLGAFVFAFILGIFLFAGRAIGKDFSRYDHHFRKATRLTWGYKSCFEAKPCDWRVFKAQGMTESALKPLVCSQAGACGVMQFMPGTALGMGLKDRLDAKQSIYAGISYDRKLFLAWKVKRPKKDRLELAFASYNAGLGHVLQAQKRAKAQGKEGILFHEVSPFLWKEPRDYVARIWRWHGRFSKNHGGVE